MSVSTLQSKLYHGATEIPNLTSLQVNSDEVVKKDVTVLTSSGRDWFPTLRESGEISFEQIYSNSNYNTLQGYIASDATAAATGTYVVYSIQTQGLTVNVNGFMQKVEIVDLKPEDVQMVKGTVCTSGKPSYSAS